MSDTKLRDLERRWRGTDAVEDEAAYLLERVKVGDLTRDRLELAAYCGHKAAIHTTGQDDEATVTDLRDWVAGLRTFQPEAPRQATVRLLRAVSTVWQEAFPSSGHMTSVLDVVSDWTNGKRRVERQVIAHLLVETRTNANYARMLGLLGGFHVGAVVSPVLMAIEAESAWTVDHMLSILDSAIAALCCSQRHSRDEDLVPPPTEEERQQISRSILAMLREELRTRALSGIAP
jgi:hypothetical protein